MRYARTWLLIVVCGPLLAGLSGCGLARTTYKTTKFVNNTTTDLTRLAVKSTRAVGRATVKVVTWPVRAIRGGPGSSADPLANHPIEPTGPEPVIEGAIPSESEDHAMASRQDLDASATRVVATESDDAASMR